MYRTQINATSPLDAGSGQMEIKLPYVLRVGDVLALGANDKRWRVVESTLIIHDEHHPKKEFCDVVATIELIK